MILTLNLYLNYLGHIQPNNLTELILGIHVEDLLFIKRHLPLSSFYESQQRQPSIPTAQARLQGLQADPRRLADATAAH